jgi:uncharacterized membrane protein
MLVLLLAPGTALAARPVLPSCGQETEVIGVGKLGTGLRSQVFDLSENGLVAVGGSATQGFTDTRAFSFHLADGGGGVIGKLFGNEFVVNALGVSRDGSVAVGSKSDGDGERAVRWGAGPREELGFPDGDGVAGGRANDVSADGQVVVGFSRGPTPGGRVLNRPFRWTPGGIVALPLLDAETRGMALGVSSDGSKVVGWSGHGIPGITGGLEAVLWENGGIVPLGALPGSLCTFSSLDPDVTIDPDIQSQALAISGDGSVIVGIDSCARGATGFLPSAVKWQDGGITGLGALGGDDHSRALGVSQDGSIIVGQSVLTGGTATAVVWTVQKGIRSLEDILTFDHGADLSEWESLSSATSVTEPPFGTVIGGFGIKDGTLEGFVAIFPCEDEDLDGLCNRWEEMGGVDLNFDGRITVAEDVLLPGANPRHKNLYVEVDFVGPAISPSVYFSVEAAFADVPNSLIGNPDGKPGIDLFVDTGEAGLPLPGNVYSFLAGSGCALTGEYPPLKSAFFGTPGERSNADLIRAKKRIYRYAIVGGTTPPGFSGQGETLGNDFIVTLSGFDSLPDGTLDQQAGTFMHELGHTLGLSHSGAQPFTESYKPNYHSVMNYLWQFPGGSSGASGLAIEAFDASWVLDYSRRAYNDLEEDALDERAGIGGSLLYWVPIGPPPARFENEARSIDFDRDKAFELLVGPVDLNQQTLGIAATPSSKLLGHNDWALVASNLCTAFANDRWEEGVYSCSEAGGGDGEMTEADLIALAAITFIDCNGNGITDDEDLLSGATDSNSDGVLDECELLLGDIDQDDDVDAVDRALFVDSFGSGEGEPEYQVLADRDTDRTVGLFDYQLWVDGFFGAAAVAQGPAAAVEVRIEPAMVSIDPGEEFVVQVESDLGGSTLGFGLDLVFDPKIIEVVGEPVLDPVWTAVFARNLDGLSGLAPATGLSGSQGIATITLRALLPGTTSLTAGFTVGDATEGILLDGSGFADPAFASAMVRVVPEPIALNVGVAALFALVALRARPHRSDRTRR